jgi:predicted GNAT superfamily acetyltransferase
MSKEFQHKELFQQVVDLLQDAKQQVLRTVNSTMVYTYFKIGRMIVEEEQNGKERAEYGKQILKGLSKQLTSEFGKGFSVENLDRMRKFYRIYSNSSSVMRIFEILNSSSVMTKSDLEKFPTTTKEFENISSDARTNLKLPSILI